jgi:hypothetical protein
MFDPADRSQAVTFDQHGHCIQEKFAPGAQSLKESPFVERKGLFAGSAVISSFDITVEFNVLGFDLCKVSTGFVIAPLLFCSHHTSSYDRGEVVMVMLK